MRLPRFLRLLPILVAALGLASLALAAPSAITAHAGGVVRVACVGDSLTQGVGADSGKSYPDQLQELLGANWQVGNFGVSGRTLLRKGDAPYWRENAFRDAQNFEPDAVIIMLGTNDTKPKNWAHKDEFYADYRDLIQTFLAFPSSPFRTRPD